MDRVPALDGDRGHPASAPATQALLRCYYVP